MKLVSVTFELPKPADDYYKRAAKKRLVSKSAVIREVLMENVQKQMEEECQPMQSAAAR